MNPRLLRIVVAFNLCLGAFPAFGADLLPSDLASGLQAPVTMTIEFASTDRAMSANCSKALASMAVKFAVVVSTGDNKSPPSWTLEVTKELQPPFKDADQLLKEIKASACGSLNLLTWGVSQQGKAKDPRRNVRKG